ncbi:MAG: thioesterase family protein [Phycisphaeraceae bacterium]
MTRSTTISVRVRYTECDPMGLVHHSTYPVWMEMARGELLRTTGLSYAELESSGVLIVVVKMNLHYKLPARYDDVLDVTATLRRVTHVRIEHDYEIHRDGLLLCKASTVLACLNREGKLQPVPTHLFE